jgi:aconitate hydratase
VADHLTAQLFESHGAGWPGPGEPVRLGADQVLLDAHGGLVTLLAFQSLGLARHACEVAVAAPARDAEGPDDLDDQRYLREAAAAFGLTFVRPGTGAPAAVHRRAFARPGRSLVSGVPGAAGAGAYAMLVLAAEPVECAAALAGARLLRERPEVVGVRLVGVPMPGVGGAELLIGLTRALERTAAGAVVEFHGEGLAHVGMSDRIALAMRVGPLLGAVAAVFPSDEITRARLAARGRDADWRRIEGGDAGFDRTLDFDLGRSRPPALDDVRVRIGPFAGDDEIAALGAAAAAGTRFDGWEVVPGGRAVRAALEPSGALAALGEAGASVLDTADARAVAPAGEERWLLGEDPERVAEGARHVSFAALRHRFGAPAAAEVRAPLDPAELLAPVPGPVVAERSALQPLPNHPAPLEGSPRGVVLWCGERDVPADRVLAWGPRAQARRADAAALAGFAFRSGEEPPLPGPGRFVAAAGRWGDGAVHEPAARALAALGVRAVLAGSFAPAHARALAVQGILPLTWARPGDAHAVSPGDELELPGIGEALERRGRITVRGLTRGVSFPVQAALGREWLGIARSGGLLAQVAGERASEVA